MSAPETPGNDSRFLSVLPALTLIAVVALFGLQALQVPATEYHHAQVSQHAQGHDQAPNHAQGELPILGQIAPFGLTERSGSSVSQAELQGKIWIADFIFTTCQAECPLMSAEMQKLQQAFSSEPQLRLVSFTVDPETDTPARLSEYAGKYGASADRWLFLTGKRPELYSLATGSFKLPVQALGEEHDHGKEHQADHKPGEPSHDHGASASAWPSGVPTPAVSSPFLHSQKFVLVDEQLRIRGYYDSNDPAALRTLIEKDVPSLLHGS